MSADKLWTQTMPDEQFGRMKEILSAPSPVGLEASMTRGVLEPMFNEFKPENWKMHTFKGNASVVFDTHPGREDMLTVMLVGHADKIRMQVRNISEDGKIWINSDSFLSQTLLGHEVLLFSENPENPGEYRVIEGGTIEALGAIHFASPKLRAGDQGIKRKQLYLDLQLHGEKRRAQVNRLGIRPGDSIILRRPIRRGFSPDTFFGAYLDNGLGCFVAEEVARLISKEEALKNTRVLFSFATHEEIGRQGSRVLAGTLSPDILIALDVNHDFLAAPGIGDRRMPPLTMGRGFTFDIGAVLSAHLNTLIEQTAIAEDIPFMRDMVGRDSGTDAMAAVFAGIDAASASIGFPIRNMHTISETGHTGDVIAAIYLIKALLKRLDTANDGAGTTAEDFREGHPRLDQASPLSFS